MRTKKILLCTEAHWMPTGYSVYTKEVLSRLHEDPRFEVAELACYATDKMVKENAKGWKIYANQPEKSSDEWHNYKASPTHEFGEYTFNHVLLDFKPDFVMDIRDWWMFEFEQRSTYRDFYSWAIMPTVDAFPQNKQWIDTFASADAVFAYSEFGKDVLLGQCRDMNFIDIASPCASQNYHPVSDKERHKELAGLDPDSFIIGTVMRNQRRKLYPDLFKTFREFLDATQASNAFLYCHTYFPDVGWEIPDLLQEYDLTNRVLFTYKCKQCGAIEPSFFKDTINHCSSCNSFRNELVGVNNKIEEEELAKVYNFFDVYVQYANSEGFGMPQLEASQSGVPIMTVSYSAMDSVGDNVGAIKIPLLTLQTECETGCKRAIPSNEFTLLKFIELYSMRKEQLKQLGFGMRQKTLQRYNWDKTADVWAEYFAATPVRDPSETWYSPPRLFDPAPSIPENLTIKDQANFLFESVLRKPEWIGNYQWKRTLRDLLYKCTATSTSQDWYFNESHLENGIRNWSPFDIKQAYEYMVKMRQTHNQWENMRIQRLKNENTLHR